MAQIKAKMKSYDTSKANALKGRVAKKEEPVVNKTRQKVDRGNVKGSVKAAPTKSEPKKYGEGNSMIIRDNKANVSEAQLKASGLSLRAYMNAWKKAGKRPGKKA